MSLAKVTRLLLPRFSDPAATVAAAVASIDRRHSLLASIVSISRMQQVPPPNFEQRLPGVVRDLVPLDEEGGGILECGRGDRRTKRGKISRGSFGKCRRNTKNALRRLREKWELPKGAPLPAPHEIA
ncbi:uncharacterized protein LOC112349481 [Selaginella moellendorffii]|uniref:uncharacterized protein LOC112349481 n=1 Tax=Selaginella moellendorffii TaxID=88036 RepID=UPI000D1C2C62|nr:uncharacterized protein LOC112349481 [Selaginella moellendorffii]|eukprot:XP_024539737.1 uncharacterized protein LOC112349481 [Selaginella moellendorffii]